MYRAAGLLQEKPKRQTPVKKTASALALILVLVVSTLAGSKMISPADANPYPYTNCDSSFVTVSIVSPENRTYNTNVIQLTITAGAYPGVWYVGYSLDGKPSKEFAPEKWDGHTFNESIWLYPLSQGSHSIIVEASTPVAPNDVLNDYAEVHFTIARETVPPDSAAPEITILSPQNRTYYETSIPLEFSVNEPNCSITYKFDSRAPIVISKNTTLTGFYYGSHNVTIYATDIAGNTGAQTVIFTLAKTEEPTPLPELSPAALPIAVSTIAVGFIALGAGLFLYRRRSRREAAQT
jgi:hypothetical protein